MAPTLQAILPFNRCFSSVGTPAAAEKALLERKCRLGDVIYDYDDANRMQALKNGSGKKIADYAYTPASLLDKRTYYDPSVSGSTVAATIDYDYNIRDWVTSIESRNPGGATNFRETLGYGGLYDGNIAVTMYRSLVGGSLTPIDLAYKYDGIKRLTAVTATAGDTAFNEAFRYDNIGRIEQTRRGRDSLGSFTGNRYRYQDGTNRLLYVTTKHKDSTVASPNYAYDDNGNMQEDKSKRMIALYDWRDMPIAFTLRSDSANWAEVEMVYDVSGNRVLKIERKKAGADTVAKAVAYVDGQLEYETPNMDSSRFTLTTAYYSGEGGTEGRVTFDSAAGAHTNYFVKDHLGSTRLMLAEDGAIEKVNAYYAYGKRERLFSGPGNKLRKEFTGKEFDDDGASVASAGDGMNLDYFGARYYDPEIIRWTSVDPVPQLWDMYSYCRGNPIIYVDSSGKFAMIAGAVLSVATGYAVATLTGQNYSAADLVTDATLGAFGAGFVSKISTLGKVAKAAAKAYKATAKAKAVASNRAAKEASRAIADLKAEVSAYTETNLAVGPTVAGAKQIAKAAIKSFNSSSQPTTTTTTNTTVTTSDRKSSPKQSGPVPIPNPDHYPPASPPVRTPNPDHYPAPVSPPKPDIIGQNTK